MTSEKPLQFGQKCGILWAKWNAIWGDGMSPFYGMDVISLLTLILSHVVYGLVSRKLAGKKGYEGYFWTGFLLGIIGLIYVAGLPVNRRHSRRRYADDAYETADEGE